MNKLHHCDGYEFTPMQPADVEAFEAAYRKNMEAGIFNKRRSPEELKQVKEHQWILRRREKAVGGVSLIDRENGYRWTEFATWWAADGGNGTGQRVVEYAKDQTRGRFLYALSVDIGAAAKLQRCGFELIGPISAIQRSSMAQHLPDQILEYNTEKRDPYVLMYWNPSVES